RKGPFFRSGCRYDGRSGPSRPNLTCGHPKNRRLIGWFHIRRRAIRPIVILRRKVGDRHAPDALTWWVEQGQLTLFIRANPQRTELGGRRRATAAIQIQIRQPSGDRKHSDHASVFRGYPPALLAVVRTTGTGVPTGNPMKFSTYENTG